MHKLTKLILAITSCISLSVNAEALTVHLPDYSVNLTYKQSVRLEQVLNDTNYLVNAHHYPAPFWQGAQLFEPARSESIYILKKTVLERLNYLARYYPDSTFKADLIASLIKKSNFEFRHFIPLDNDLVRLQTQLNPLMQGEYKLITPERSEHIFLIGTTAPRTRARLDVSYRPDHYFTSASLPGNSDTRTLYLIQPDGTKKKIFISNWKADMAYPAPGAILFSGFKNLPPEYANLNDQIAELLRYMESPKTGSDQ